MSVVRGFITLWMILASSVIAAADDGTTLIGAVEVTSPSARGSRLELIGARCGAFSYSEWRDSDGVILAREELLHDDVEAGSHWQRYRMQRLSIGQDVLAEYIGNSIRLDIREGDRRREVRLAVDGDVLAGPMLVTHLQSKLPLLRRGKVIVVPYLVAEQAMVLELRAARLDNGTDGLTNVRIEASSAFLRPFVPTTRVTFDQEGRFVGMQGRLLPQIKRMTPLDGVIKVSYPINTQLASIKPTCKNTRVS